MIPRATRPLLAVLASLNGSAAYPQEQAPMPVTSDTLPYCVQLQHLVLSRPVRPPDANRLLTEGRRMCDHGEVRAGILRLRRALRLINHPSTVQ